jgi:hypothetical protein
LTKWFAAVGIGTARPLSAVAAVGISGFFLENSMIGSSLACLSPSQARAHCPARVGASADEVLGSEEMAHSKGVWRAI